MSNLNRHLKILIFSASLVLIHGTVLAVTFNSIEFRNGQTFITWPENEQVIGERYFIYRSDEEIDAGDLPSMTPVFIVEEGSSIARLERLLPNPNYRNFFTRDLRNGGTALSDDTGLLVWTTDRDQDSWYAIVAEIDGELDFAGVGLGSIQGPITELKQRPRPLLVREATGSNNRKARVWLQYMDLNTWNPTFPRIDKIPEGEDFRIERTPGGYAFSYMVLDPINYDPTQEYAILVDLHGLNQRYYVDEAFVFDWPIIYINMDDPQNSFWYGWSATHDYRTSDTPTTGPIVNYTESRTLRALFDTIDDPLYNADEERVILVGHSMGGTGALSLGLRYPELFAAVYASQPFTDPRDQLIPGTVCPEPVSLEENRPERIFGEIADELPMMIESPFTNGARPDAAVENRPFEGIPAWDWADQVENLRQRFVVRELPALMLDFGSRDCLISYDTQSLSFLTALEDLKHNYTAAILPEAHLFLGFVAITPGIGPDDDFPGGESGCDYSVFRCMELSTTMSFPAITNNSGNASLTPDTGAMNYYNKNIMWATPWFDEPYRGEVIDNEYLWQCTLFAIEPLLPEAGMAATVDVTARRAVRFSPPVEAEVRWSARSLATGELLDQGLTIVENSGVRTAAGIPVLPDGTVVQFELAPPSSWIFE